ncbi:PRTRC genetic system ThiF family protein [Mucilaginibacter sp. SG538B]|uniref:PRTRC system ThiF family protein n=1 Tax=Mucilaginibacter sp. SG538B TaxID=2587021 RepID=UPI0017BA90EE|nr:PRTRC system ThiF family protein [Mucilaginibacter sp. SG538B]NVM66862.1 PRTRC genetic system ThiF family protein [Mucilaginibacter sp. SG538B]
MKMKIKELKPIVHMVDNELLQPRNRVTVNLIGAGGTGSHVLTALARLHYMLNELGHPGIAVTVIDSDVIERKNRLRMLFTDADVGFPKSVVLVNRVNRFFGTNWKAVTERYDEDFVKSNLEMAMATITISCVDSVASRFCVAAILKEIHQKAGYSRNVPKYWLDYGNSRHSGQVILATVGEIGQPKSKKFETVGSLPMVTDEFPGLLAEAEEKDKGYNCSASVALLEQDLFINTPLAYIGVEILKKMFCEGMLFDRGFFMNLKDYRTQPLKVSRKEGICIS